MKIYVLKLNCDEIIINTHYQHEMIYDFIKNNYSKESILISYEKELLDTGGGVKKAMSLINATESIVVNSDILWNEKQINSLKEMDSMFDRNFCDSLLCLSLLY